MGMTSKVIGLSLRSSGSGSAASMEVHSKSPAQVEVYLALLSELLLDLQRNYPDAAKSFERDRETLRSRVATEGISFLTKTLPKLGKAFDRALETQRFEVPREFKRAPGYRAIPAFLQGMLKRCFTADGNLVDLEPSLVRDVRQVCYMFYKLELPYSRSQEKSVIDKFLNVEKELHHQSIEPSAVTYLAQEIVGDVLDGVDLRQVTPRHGPGAVATGEKQEAKWVFHRLYNAIHQVFPYYDYFMVGTRSELLDRVQWYRGLDRSANSGTAKVVLVPKDSRGPRLISCEPLEYQWIQQGVGRVLVEAIERNALTRGQINFRDQSINAGLALTSSEFGHYATIDLQDASDRVSLELVRMLFPKEHFRVLEAARSTATRLPDGREIALSKYAPMGSALCFPVEALCFWAVSVAAILTHSGGTGAVAQSVFVYGDDIIIPASEYETVVGALQAVGLVVNEQKCFRRGLFRESCGCDAYAGVVVTPTRVSTLWSGSSSDGSALDSYASYANHFARKGYTNTASCIRNLITGLYGPLPFGDATSGFPCVEVESPEQAEELNCSSGVRWRYSKSLQRLEFRVKRLKAKTRKTTLSGWERLLRNLTQGAGQKPDEETVPRRIQIRTSWLPV